MHVRVEHDPDPVLWFLASPCSVEGLSKHGMLNATPKPSSDY